MGRLLLLLPALLALLSQAVAAAPPARTIDALFAVRFLGFRLGELEASWRADDRGYAVTLKGGAAGLWGLLSGATYDGSTTGVIAPDGRPVPVLFQAHTRRYFKSRDQSVAFTGGRPARVEITPARDRTPMSDPALVTDARLDPLTFLGLFLQDRTAGCPGPGNLYDGRRLTRVTFTPVTGEPGRLTCDGVYEIVKGPDHSIRKGFRRFGVVLEYDLTRGGRLDAVRFRSGDSLILLQRMGG